MYTENEIELLENLVSELEKETINISNIESIVGDLRSITKNTNIMKYIVDDIDISLEYRTTLNIDSLRSEIYYILDSNEEVA